MALGPTDRATDPKWPKILSLTVHEFRSPLTVVAGYIRMLLKERAGPLSDQQRKLLEEADKSCARLSALLAEVSELSQLESGTATFNRSRLDLPPLLADVIAALPPLPDRAVPVELRAPATAPVVGDAVRLKGAFGAILVALRRELVTDDPLVVMVKSFNDDGPAAIRITIGDASRIDQLERIDPAEHITFDEWRGGVGLSLATARRILEGHGGRLVAPKAGGRLAALIVLPVAAV